MGGEAVEMSLVLTTDRKIRDLNREYRQIDKSTDVLAFALEEGPELCLPPGFPRQLGDVVVSLETVQRQAKEAGHAQEAELAWVICHGTLHLLGYDHQNQLQLEQMRQRELEVLTALGLERNWATLLLEV